MTGVLSKRQQARNEKQLQELVQSVPGNNICADCHARNPGTSIILPVFKLYVQVLLTLICGTAWASWSVRFLLYIKSSSDLTNQ